MWLSGVRWQMVPAAVPVSKRWGLPPGGSEVIWTFSTGNEMSGRFCVPPYLPLRPVADPSTLPSTRPTPGRTRQAPAFTHRELLWCASGDSCLRRSLEGLFCKRNLNLHPPPGGPRPDLLALANRQLNRSPSGTANTSADCGYTSPRCGRKTMKALVAWTETLFCIHSEGLLPQQAASDETL